MRTSVKIALCVILMLFAAASLITVLADLGVLPAVQTAGQAEWSLREWNGYVAVFSPPDAQTPGTVTDIRVGDLPPADRRSLAGGVTAESYDQVIRLLEDYGA